jgi:hypothetical protein
MLTRNSYREKRQHAFCAHLSVYKRMIKDGRDDARFTKTSPTVSKVGPRIAVNTGGIRLEMSPPCAEVFGLSRLVSAGSAKGLEDPKE